MEIKFFYDKFEEGDIAGIFSIWHIISVLLFFSLFALLIWRSRRLDERGVRRVHFLVALIITAAELIKIGLRIYKHQSPDSWVPLYYCSLFIFAVWAALAPWEPLRRHLARSLYGGRIFRAVGPDVLR
ncbi:MAG: hypothetical protein IKA64_02420 [Clostridia bacterium]|nr:hypothetical protein [Clostridia bacterium]